MKIIRRQLTTPEENTKERKGGGGRGGGAVEKAVESEAEVKKPETSHEASFLLHRFCDLT